MGIVKLLIKFKMEDIEEKTTPAKKFPKSLFVSKISNPLAGKKLSKRIFKLLLKISKREGKNNLIKGIKDLMKALRKNKKGIVFLAADISPIDIITHIPTYCEELSIPYVYVPSKEGLGLACRTQRACACAMIVELKSNDNLLKKYNKICNEINEDNSYI